MADTTDTMAPPAGASTTLMRAAAVIEAQAVRAEGLAAVLDWLSIAPDSTCHPSDRTVIRALSFLSDVAGDMGNTLSEAASPMLRAAADQGGQPHA